jgi:UDP-glucose 4-epimerase
MDWSGRRTLVTGGAGFLGSNLVETLAAAGAAVRALDNLRDGDRGNLAGAAGAEFVQADVRDEAAVARAVSGCEVVFHLAANASVPASVEDPAYDFETNVCGTFNVLRAARDAGVRRLVFTSSAAVYGPPRRAPVDESHPLEPISPYGGSKLAAERLLAAHARTFGFEVAIARVFNTFGPRQRRYVAYDLLMKLLRNPRRLEVLGDGAQRRDYCYVSDCVRALLLLAEAPAPEPLVANVSGGRTVSIRELVALILGAVSLRDTEVVYGFPSWRGDIEVLSGEIARLRSLGYEPRVPLEEGILRFASWFQSVHGTIG